MSQVGEGITVDMETTDLARLAKLNYRWNGLEEYFQRYRKMGSCVSDGIINEANLSCELLGQ